MESDPYKYSGKDMRQNVNPLPHLTRLPNSIVYLTTVNSIILSFFMFCLDKSTNIIVKLNQTK